MGIMKRAKLSPRIRENGNLGIESSSSAMEKSWQFLKKLNIRIHMPSNYTVAHICN